MQTSQRRLWKLLCANVLLWSAPIGWHLQQTTAVATLSPTETAVTVTRTVKVKQGTPPPPDAPAIRVDTTLIVPFTAQAPYEDWGAPYQEACEEAALLMVDAFLQGTTLPSSIADQKIVALTAAIAAAGYGESVTIAELAEIVHEQFGYQARVIEDVTIESIKQELLAGHPVIVPAAGKELQNPYFSGGGPWYHMLVITGFRGDEFITNDPGTVLGHGLRYKQEHLLSAVHDWTGQGETVNTGKAVMLVIER